MTRRLPGPWNTRDKSHPGQSEGGRLEHRRWQRPKGEQLPCPTASLAPRLSQETTDDSGHASTRYARQLDLARTVGTTVKRRRQSLRPPRHRRLRSYYSVLGSMERHLQQDHPTSRVCELSLSPFFHARQPSLILARSRTYSKSIDWRCRRIKGSWPQQEVRTSSFTMFNMRERAIILAVTPYARHPDLFRPSSPHEKHSWRPLMDMRVISLRSPGTPKASGSSPAAKTVRSKSGIPGASTLSLRSALGLKLRCTHTQDGIGPTQF